MGITVVIITHEMAVTEAVCDRVAIIDKSHIAEIGEVSRVFAEPKSKIGRQLILGDAAEKVEFGTGRLFRIIFDGLASSEPGDLQRGTGMQGAGEHHVRSHQGYKGKGSRTDDH